MILRRLSAHVREQNWFAVALDFLIVVVGILIAFQITTWGDARKDARAEQRYLAELVRDLEADVEEMQTGRNQTLSRIWVSEAILRTIDPAFERFDFFVPIDAEPPDPELHGYLYAQLVGSFYFVGTRRTFDELVQSGNVGVLSDRELVNDLTLYYSDLDRQRGDDEILLRQVEPILDYYRENGLGMVDRASIEDGIVRARADREFLGILKLAQFYGHWQYSRLTSRQAAAERMLAAVRSNVEPAR